MAAQDRSRDGAGPVPLAPTLDIPPAVLAPAEPEGASVYTPSNLRTFLEAGVKAVADSAFFADQRQALSVGPFYSRSFRGGSETHCNWYWKFITDLKPALVTGDPQVAISSRNPDATGQHDDALEAWINRTFIENRFGEELDTICENMFWAFGVALVTPEEVPGTESEWMQAQGAYGVPTMRAKIKSLHYAQCFIDPDHDIQDAEYMGHWEILTLRQILEDSAGTADGGGWDLEAVREIASGPGDQDATEARNSVRGDGVQQIDVKQGQIVVYHMWNRENNTLYTLGYKQTAGETEGRFLRQPSAWAGHDRGPYVWAGLAWVKGRPIPLSLTAVAERVVRELDEHRTKARKDASKAKRCVVMEGSNALKTWAKAENGDGVNGDAKAVKEVSTGGMQEETAQYIAYLNSELEELFGLSQIRQGNLSGSSTGEQPKATAVVAAETAQGIRREYFARRFRAFVREVSVRTAHIGWHNVQVQSAIPQEDQRTGRMVSKTFYGGVKANDPAEWEDVEADIDVEPYTVGGSDQRAVIGAIDQVGVILAELQAMVIQNPLGALIMNWENWLDDKMKAVRIQGGGRRYVNYAAVRMLVKLQLMGMMGMGGPFAGGMPGGDPGGMTMGAARGGAGGTAATPSKPGGTAAGSSDNPMKRAQSVGSAAGGMTR
jgi:hypothetical protein